MEGNLCVLNAVVLIVSAIAIILRRTKSLSSSSTSISWPAGHKSLPIIGNLHQLGGEALHVALDKLHGGVMTIWIGSWRPVIVISDIDKAWEVLVTESSDFSARENFPAISEAGSTGLYSNSDSPPPPMIQEMQEEALLNDGIVNPLDHLKKATLRLLSRLVFVHSFDNDSFMESMQSAVEDMIRIGASLRLSEAFSYAKYLPSHKHAVREFYQLKHRVEDMLEPFISRNGYPTNSYLNFLLSQDYPEAVIRSCIFELFILGVDSTASTTTWALAFLTHDQLVQEELYRDIKQIRVDGGSLNFISFLVFFNCLFHCSELQLDVCRL